MTLRMSSSADAEFSEAIAWYDERSRRVAIRFADEFEKGIESIRQHPESHALVKDGFRCCKLSRFPYGLVYTIENSGILIVAVMHLCRGPEYRKERL
ncbi:MAG: type II toxin-antitoxin system RelE/ParE family toxin [Planctomycetaceae bacterium]|nr:type II toxin-antitoxin system RelE/ParE family toxin [Planctomycetaceae bacterium]